MAFLVLLVLFGCKEEAKEPFSSENNRAKKKYHPSRLTIFVVWESILEELGFLGDA
jgi:hypothetical protein